MNSILIPDEEYGQFIYFGEDGEIIKEKKDINMNIINDSYFDENYINLNKPLSDIILIKSSDDLQNFTVLSIFYDVYKISPAQS